MPHLVVLALAVAVGAFSTCVQATGYFLNGAGTNARAIAGAGVALAQDPMAVAANPAASVALEGFQYEIGVTLLRPRPELYAGPLPDQPFPDGAFPINPGRYESDPEVPLQVAGTFAVPNGAANWRLNEKWAVGFSVYGNGGLNATFDDFDNELCPPGTQGSGVLCGGTLSSDLAQTFLAPHVAWQPIPWLRLGVSPLLVWQVLEITGFGAFSGRSQDPDNFSDNGHDHALGYGIKGGVQVEPWRRLSLGVVVQSKIEMDEFDDYAGFLPEQGLLEIPPYFQVGLGWNLTPRLTLALDYSRIFYSSVSATGNPGSSSAPFGADDGPGFGWDDVKTYKLGVIFRATQRWEFRAGYATSNAQIESNDVFFNLVSGSIITDEFDLGVGYNFDPQSSVQASVHLFDSAKVTGPNPTLPEQALELHVYGVSLDISWQRRFQ